MSRLSGEAVSQIIRDVAERIIDPAFGTLSTAQIHQKTHPGDLVTDIDRRAERALSAELVARGGGVAVGEEAVFADPAILSGLPEAPLAWVIDPIDGTGNFIKASDDHAVMVAEVRAGRAVRGWIFQPRRGHMYFAEAGAGTWCDGERLSRGPSGDPVVAVTTHKAFHQAPQPASGPRLEWGWSRWCCGVDYPRLCAGEVDATVYLHSHPWDHLAGALMVRELGGVVRTASGRDFGVTEIPGDPLIVASDERAHSAVAGALRRL
ncbi:inositol monophosphatase family protein [Acidipropionibacterium virtanenii]|uniref:Fructose-1, 6-bisphosphatase/inositol-1-monophosphatase n=1 Tax=Acidipropionibacterium virtanenii TaxID=2057246 RepID=A0A344UUY4_9ACTN|nr:inositol monophosphatase [Acidipropionibacterium virtanenii]AXE39082.1 Fructose-1,6-bisphosphatase/inositol-1-monophosphatase [Acidipropionibacterium virtanenii]